MRFVCDSCRAQYMISDEKVGAKGVKVRCKKCGHVIHVRPAGAAGSETPVPRPTPVPESSLPAMPAALGTPPPEGSIFDGVEDDEIGAVFDQVLTGKKVTAETPAVDAAAREASAAAEAAAAAPAPEDVPQTDWYVAIDDKQTGPLTLEQVKDHWEKGEVGPDSLCWRAGYPDWLPLSEVPALASILAPRPAPKPVIVAPADTPTPAPQAPVSSAFSARAPTRAEAPAASTGGGAGGWKPSAASVLAALVKEEDEALSKPAPKPAAPRAPSGGGGGLLDLPPAPDASLEQTMVTPHASPGPAGAVASFQPAAGGPPVLTPGGEGAAVARAAPYAGPAAQPYASPQAAPYPVYPPHAAPPAPQRGRAGLVAGVAVGTVLLLAAGASAAYFLTRPADAPPAVATRAEPATPPPAPAQQPVTPPAPAPTAAAQPAAAQPASAAPATAPVQAPAVAQAQPPAAAPAAPVAAAPERRERTRTTSSTSASRPRAGADEEPGTIVARAPAAPRVQEPKGGDDEFDELFGSGKKEAPAASAPAAKRATTAYVPPPPGGADVKESLTMSDVMQTVVSYKPALVKCAEEQKKRDPARASGKVIMRWNVTTAGRPTGISCQTPELCGSYFTTCVTGVIRGMQFPRTRVQGDPINFPLSF